MPGFSLVKDLSSTRHSDRGRFRVALTLATHDDSYQTEVVSAEPSLALGWSTYPEYPLSCHTLTHAVLLIDGVVYDAPEQEVMQFAERIDNRPDRCERFSHWISDWLKSHDAECVVAYAETKPEGGLVVTNDVLGRLPVFMARENERLFLGRELKVIAALLDSVEPDRQGLAETIQFGFPLGSRTLLKGISRLRPGSQVCAGGTAGARVSRYHRWDLADRGTTTTPSRDDLRRATSVFAEACGVRAERFPERPCVLLLSGGLDSRAVAGG